jgi:MraZ protein
MALQRRTTVVLFTGVSEHTIDAKLRLAIPAKYRNQWQSERDGGAWFCVPWPGSVSDSPDPHSTGILRLYTEAAFTKLAEQLDSSLTPQDNDANLDADYFSFAERLEMDSQGRIAIPKPHMELTKLNTEVVIVGARNRLEVRDRATWVAGATARFANLPNRVAQSKPSQTHQTQTPPPER